MPKFIIGGQISIQVTNFSHGMPVITMVAPVTYTLYDWIEIIKMYAGYGDSHDWIFTHPKNLGESLSLKKDGELLKKMSYDEYRNYHPYITCQYGPIKMDISWRTSKKYSKVHPTILNARGKFPTEEEFAKSIDPPDRLRQYTAEDLSDLGMTMQEYFKGKYKISNETDERSSDGANKLERI